MEPLPLPLPLPLSVPDSGKGKGKGKGTGSGRGRMDLRSSNAAHNLSFQFFEWTLQESFCCRGGHDRFMGVIPGSLPALLPPSPESLPTAMKSMSSPMAAVSLPAEFTTQEARFGYGCIHGLRINLLMTIS